MDIEPTRQDRRADWTLLLVALIWGTGFIATEYALRSGMRTTLMMPLRFLMAALMLLPFVWRRLCAASQRTLAYGCGAGVILCAAFYAQTCGQARTSVSHSAFLTATNVIIVPFIVWGITGKRPVARLFMLAIGTLIGMGILTLGGQQSGASLGGDLLVLLCAALFALHVAYLGLSPGRTDALLIAFLQMATAGIVSAVVLLGFDRGALIGVPWRAALGPVLYLACFSTCLCFALQTWAQQRTSPAKASILLAAEGLFGSLFSVMLGFEPLTAPLFIGGLIIALCVALVEVDFSSVRWAKKNLQKNP